MSVTVQALIIRRCYYLLGKNLCIITPLVLLLVASIVVSMWSTVSTIHLVTPAHSPQGIGIYWSYLMSILLPTGMSAVLHNMSQTSDLSQSLISFSLASYFSSWHIISTRHNRSITLSLTDKNQVVIRTFASMNLELPIPCLSNQLNQSNWNFGANNVALPGTTIVSHFVTSTQVLLVCREMVRREMSRDTVKCAFRILTLGTVNRVTRRESVCAKEVINVTGYYEYDQASWVRVFCTVMQMRKEKRQETVRG